MREQLPTMKITSTTRLTAVPLAIAVIGTGLLVVSCDRSDESPGDQSASPEVQGLVQVLAALPEFELTNEAGEKFGTSELRGKMWVANFIFTRCKATCPMQTSMMTQLQEQLKKHPIWDDILLVSISVDPEYDTPEVLREYAQKAQADEQHWRFLTGARDEIWQLSKGGFKLPVGDNPTDPNFPLFHSSQWVLVDGQDRIRGYYDGLSQEGLDRVQRDLDRVLKEAVQFQYR